MGGSRTSYKAAARLASIAFLASAAFASDRIYQTANLSPLNMPPTFDSGYLIVRGPGAEFDVYGRDGALAYRIPRAGENWSMCNAAVDTDGTAAVAMERGYAAGRIAVYSVAGSLLKTIETSPFLPAYVRFGPDHSIWAAGRGVLRRYSRDGEQLGSYTLLQSEGNWQEPVLQLPGVRVCQDRVGYLMHSEPGALLWVETDLNGKELGRWPFPTREHHLGPVFAGGKTYMSTDTAVVVLNRESGKWEQTFVAERGRLIGSEGDALVFLDRGSTTVRWVVP